MENKRRCLFWNIGTVNSVTLSKHIESVPGINCSMHYIGCAFTFFLFDVVDKDLSSKFYLSSGSFKVWYDILASHKMGFETFVATELLDSKYLIEHFAGVWQIIATKIISFDPNIITTILFLVRVNEIS